MTCPVVALNCADQHQEATVADAPAIQKLNRDGMGYEYPLSDSLAALKDALSHDREIVLVATLGDAVVGYVHAETYRLLYALLMVNVLGIAVDGGARRQGVGLTLLTAVEHWARDRGAEALRLVSGDTRDDAHHFYAAAGLTSAKRQLNFRKHL